MLALCTGAAGFAASRSALLHAAASPRASPILLSAAVDVMLEGSTWRITLNVGRERGTWMPEDWAASGARLSLPLEVTLTGEPLVGRLLDRSVEAAARGPDATDTRKLVVASSARFVGAQGEETVNVVGGAWATSPTGRCGESRLRFYLDFPDGAARNDVSIPVGRVYFNTACWDEAGLSAAAADAAKLEQELETLVSEQEAAKAQPAGGGVLERAQAVRSAILRTERAEGVQRRLAELRSAMPDGSGYVDGPGGVRVAGGGGLSIKNNDAKNLWGFLGEVYFILGRFSVGRPRESLEGLLMQ